MNTIFKAISKYLENENEDVKVTIEIDGKKRKEKSKLTLLLRGKILNGRESDVDLQVEVVSRPSVHKTRKDKILSKLKEKNEQKDEVVHV
jgi:hypothetical protein